MCCLVYILLFNNVQTPKDYMHVIGHLFPIKSGYPFNYGCLGGPLQLHWRNLLCHKYYLPSDVINSSAEGLFPAVHFYNPHSLHNFIHTGYPLVCPVGNLQPEDK